MQHTQDLFEHGHADVMSRDAAMERGTTIALDASNWVRIDRRGVYMLNKFIRPEGVVTHEECVSPLPMLPLGMKVLQNQPYLEVLYGTRAGTMRMDSPLTVRMETVLLDAVVKPEQHTRTIKELAERGFVLNRAQWLDLAQVLRQVMRTCNADHSLPVEQVSPLQWQAQRNFLVPRPKKLVVIKGGRTAVTGVGQTQASFPTLRPV